MTFFQTLTRSPKLFETYINSGNSAIHHYKDENLGFLEAIIHTVFLSPTLRLRLFYLGKSGWCLTNVHD